MFNGSYNTQFIYQYQQVVVCDTLTAGRKLKLYKVKAGHPELEELERRREECVCVYVCFYSCHCAHATLTT